MALIFNEQFESTGTPGYDETATGVGSDWTEIVDDGCIEDEKYLTSNVTNAPASWGSQCLRSYVDVVSEEAHSYNTLDANQPVVYVRADFIAETGLTDAWENTEWLRICDESWNLLFVVLIGGIGTARHIHFNPRYDDSDHWQDGGAFDLNTPYRVDVKWDTTANTWEWKINGVTKHSGTGLTSTREPRIINVGVYTAYVTGIELFTDNVQIATDGWIPADGGVVSPRRLPFSISSLGRGWRN